MKYQVTCETTPNPQSLKFVINTAICKEQLEIADRNQATRSPLATKILGFPWAKSVFLGENFVTITKEEWLEWDMISETLAQMIQEYLERGEPVLLEKPKKRVSEKGSDSKKDSPAIQKIKEILEKEIQPAVAMDGGYIEFVSYENKKVYLNLQGACSGCPSSSYTLKEGIETRLKQDIPEIEEVISI